MSLTNHIESIIKNALPNATIYVVDPHNDGEHFEAIVICESFNEKSLVQQHQSVMKPLKEAFDSTVHALALKTFTPERWEKDKHRYPMAT